MALLVSLELGLAVRLDAEGDCRFQIGDCRPSGNAELRMANETRKIAAVASLLRNDTS